MGHRLALRLTVNGPARYLQVARGLGEEIERGRLKPGDRLPSIRELASWLGVQRKTIVAGLDELEAQGWIVRRPRSGIFVSEEILKALPPQATNVALRAGFELPPALPVRPLSARAEIDLLGGLPDVSRTPKRELARAYRRVLLMDRKHTLMNYADARGHPRLRDALAEWLVRTRGVRATPDTLNVVRGAQHGLYLAARALLRPGDWVAVEQFTHPAVTSLLRMVGARLAPVRLDGDGLDVDALERLCRQKPIRALYTTPHHQLPTTVTMSGPRRVKLLELARARRFMILEDDYDHEFQYEGHPVMPLAYADRGGVVVYFGTLSKVVAPGLRAAFVVAAPEVSQRLAEYRTFVDRQGDQISERALAEVLEDGDVERHIRRMLRIYRARRDALCAALRRDLPQLQFSTPRGGMAVWVDVPRDVDVDAWARRALDQGVSFQPASHFAVGRASSHHARLGFASATEAQLGDAVRRLMRALRHG